MITPKYEWNLGPSDVKRIMDKHIRKNEQNIASLLDRKASKYAEWIKETKIARGSWTGTDWHRLVNTEVRGQAEGARMETKAMYRSVDKTSTYSPEIDVWEVQFGIPTVAGGGEEYFTEQEIGFDLELASGQVRFVPGMESSRAAINIITKEIKKDFLRIGFLRGKGSDVRGQRILDLADTLGFEKSYAMEYAPSEAQKAAFDKFKEIGARIIAQRSAARQSRNNARDAAIISQYGSLFNYASRRFDR